MTHAEALIRVKIAKEQLNRVLSAIRDMPFDYKPLLQITHDLDSLDEQLFSAIREAKEEL